MEGYKYESDKAEINGVKFLKNLPLSFLGLLESSTLFYLKKFQITWQLFSDRVQRYILIIYIYL